MITPDKSRTQLKEFLDQPREMAEREKHELQRSVFVESISFDLIDFVAEGIELYLTGKAPSLDSALGLKRRGRPRTDLRTGKHFELAKSAFCERISKKSWEKICDEIGYNDPRELKHIVERYSPAISEHYGRKMADSINQRRSMKSKRSRKRA